MTFAEKIKTLRKEKGMTQMQLAAVTNISLAVIAGVESGRRNPSKEMARRLAEYFNVPIETFIVENTEIPKTDHPAEQINNLEKLGITLAVTNFEFKNKYLIPEKQRSMLIDMFCKMHISDPNAIEYILERTLSQTI